MTATERVRLLLSSVLLLACFQAHAQGEQPADQPAATSSAQAAADSAASASAVAVAAAASAAQSASAAASSSRSKGAPDTLPIARILCARVMERPGVFERAQAKSNVPNTPRLNLTSADCTIPENSTSDVNRLVGAGDVELFLDPASWAVVAAHQANSSSKLHLYLNGVDMGADADLISTEDTSQQARLHYHVKAGPSSQTLWASLYRTVGLVKPEALRVGLGWDAIGQTSTAPSGPTVSVTNYFSLICAIFVVVVLLYIWLIRGSAADVFRDSPLPAWWADAFKDREELKSRLRIQATTRTIPPSMQQTWKTKAREFLKANPSYKDFNPADEEAYSQQAQEALDGKPVTTDVDQAKAYFGLVLSNDEWKPVRGTFSLSRVQLGLWFMFAICAGVFLWIVYGDLPAIDGSLLGLLGISTVTTVGSLAVDRNAGGRPYSPSQGLFADLVTGFNDDKQQIHRLQAVVVNILLLAVGIVHVAQSLTYPTFDSTWLGFLSISGVALVVGKQYLES
ncbi:hypothetical protein [Paraburkholderia caribensis]|uniref:hypothetical protein n=1 Tax=Paraburkholderia caribensis TaxID=75105 RepID=UPI001591B294|nr:hypothetical protein [Paraburkholderia caribensis]